LGFWEIYQINGIENQESRMKKKNLKKTIIHNSTKGFTLLEMLLSVALITVISGIGVPIYQSFQTRNDLDIAEVAAVQTLRRAQVLSQAVDGDTNWGMLATTSSIILFKGASYAARDSGYDEIFEIPASITISGTQEYVFSKFTGEPQTTGTTILTSNSNEVRNIVVNSKGMVSY